MAKTLALAIGIDNNRIKLTHQLGSKQAIAHADTWRTFTRCTVYSDGSGFISVTRDGVLLHSFEFGPEGAIEA